MIFFRILKLAHWTEDIYCASRDMKLNLYCFNKIDLLKCL